jgi:hypothetical protein
MDELPPLVARAHAAARRAGFPLTRAEAGPDRPSACLPGVGRFLAMLAAGCTGGRIGELGTSAGVGASWMASPMPASCTLTTAETDEQLVGHRPTFPGRPMLDPPATGAGQRAGSVTGAVREVHGLSPLTRRLRSLSRSISLTRQVRRGRLPAESPGGQGVCWSAR